MSKDEPKSYRSKIAVCRIQHTRVRPKRHQLVYTMPYFVIDLDELDALHKNLPLFSYGSANVFRFDNADHGRGFRKIGESLSLWISRELNEIGVSDPISRIEVVCLPRILGYVFNPMSIFFAYDAKDRAVGVVYEVNNTFGEKQIYPFSLNDVNDTRLKHTCEKKLYVSPFNNVVGGYEFTVTPPRSKFNLAINYRDDEGVILHAAMSGKTIPLSKRSLISVAARYPLAAFTVIAAIHWEALKLWMKGVPFRSRRRANAEPSA